MKRSRELSKSQIKKTLDLSTSKVQDVTLELEGANKELDDRRLNILVVEKKTCRRNKRYDEVRNKKSSLIWCY